MEVADEVERTIKEAAGKAKVILIRLSVGKGISKAELAKELHKKFPFASIEMEKGGEEDEVIVHDIEVE